MGNVYAKSNFSNNPYDQMQEELSQRPTEEDRLEITEEDLKHIPARVEKINVDGLQRTYDDIVTDCIKDLFKAQSFFDVLIRANETRQKLDELGCFKQISVQVDTNKAKNASDEGYEVTFDVKEFSRLTGGISTYVGNNEGNVLIGLKSPNIFGRGERVQVEYMHGSKSTKNFNISFIKPIRGAHRQILKTSILQSTSEWPGSGYKLKERGLLLDWAFYSKSIIKHNLQWEGMIRDVSALSRNISFDVREQCGISLKSALKHVLSIDLRDDMVFPSEGNTMQLTTELAGLGGNVGFLKNELYYQDNFPILSDIVLQASVMCGYMLPLTKDKNITIADKCFLGGPLTLRGFDHRGVGPHSDSDALGSTAYWAVGLHVFAPLPFRPGKGGFGELFRTHFFVNMGNIGDFGVDAIAGKDLIDTLKTNTRVSYGAGLALRLGNMARVEVNYCFPFKFDRGDLTHPGVQFGIGVQFL